MSHSPLEIWDQLQPILNNLMATVGNLHSLSDWSVTQYLNQIIFKVLATPLQDFYSNFTSYYHEAGHGKGATYKRTAGRLVASGTDIYSLGLSQTLQTIVDAAI